MVSDNKEMAAEKELEQLAKEWTAGIYGFFKPDPIIDYVKGCCVHTFICGATHCRGTSRHVRRFVNTKDAKSTSNLRRHAVKCWGEDNVNAARSRPADEIHKATKGGSVSGSIMAAFEQQGKGKVSYSHRQHTRTETSLMKTGWPGYWLPSSSMSACDVKLVFAKTRNRITRILQEHPGTLSFATDVWSSPNHKAYVAVTVHFKRDGIPISMLLDIVKVPHSHSSLNLAKAF
ncbi:uncharacterized protein LACBIDRAFT_306233 [Laccaria bicolor S238N-H82]|uniref:Predicted protein n=1 Tax=Laccaria bicolor (strain S238N-H82 / ATCC MYA-4686) TaxID=486041 RepID=B0CT78_LACBS|nr:uncharacterized protein LACBIDRAFT_306233 [Laccaria bicolor S238N-H82]EDR14413.1 predicted protein [Laccaria bicolor S238N-H82]|eukprot:XP_001874972.1 predicted protein [Laccaria bicolor S238N-H82]